MHKGITRFGSITVGIALALGAARPVLAGEVRAVSVDTSATGTRAEIQLEGKGEYKTISLAGPDRLVIDLPASTAMRGLKLPAGAGIVKSVRTGQPTPDTLRIVFDLSSSVVAMKPRLESTGSGARLVLEWPGDGPAPATAAVKPAVVKSAVVDPPPATSQAGTQQASAQTAAQATAALTSAAVQQATAKPPAASSSQLSPQAILNGQSAQPAAPTATSEPRAEPAPTQPAPIQYTIATGVPAPATGATSIPAEAASASTEPAYKPAPQLPIRTGMRPLVIAIDAGHGGQDPGAIGPTGKYEKHAVLAISRDLARQINATPGMRAYLIRDTDIYVERPQRARRARAAKADMFVSIHADAAENRSALGSSVYVLSLRGASSQHARWLADKENASDLVGGVRLTQNTLSNVLLDLAQSGHMKASQDAAGYVLDSLKQLGKTHKQQIEFANFEVLRNSDMPAMLVETGYISNPEEEKRLMDPAHQRKVAAAVLAGIQSYFTRQPPPGTLFAARAAAAGTATVSNGSAGAP